MEMVRDIRAALVAAGWHDDEFGVHQRGGRAAVSLGLDLVGTTPALGGNAASGLVVVLRAAGFELEPAGWQHLLSGEESTVTRLAYTTPVLARRLYGTSPSRAQLRAAAQWAERRMAPLNRGGSPLLWPADRVDVGLAERAEMHAAGKSHPGNRTSGAERRGSRPAAGTPLE